MIGRDPLGMSPLSEGNALFPLKILMIGVQAQWIFLGQKETKKGTSMCKVGEKTCVRKSAGEFRTVGKVRKLWR